MKITITDQASEKINQYRRGKEGWLKLKYDAEECGCIMCGVTNLWLVSDLEDDDYKVETNNGDIYIEKSKEVFLDEVLTIDFNDATYCFQLKSPNQYLNPRMNFFDKTKQVQSK
ncbi:iron-sulfur cluster biosynthesis family protein [Bacillus sp. V3B]|uniref:iron-sulfur cluster biosynthesis family protein n=1 Tax=Bacillus sp. V3B TaxID=2804915 RepID=UPI00210D65D7|nr:iron-sulfur cluster biosynthesis family protein [Bacillus sp. V3B]MCQ6273796.1 iron-sulfur cluster biosynthesis family protein [Bacillus sp. V3B]